MFSAKSLGRRRRRRLAALRLAEQPCQGTDAECEAGRRQLRGARGKALDARLNGLEMRERRSAARMAGLSLTMGRLWAIDGLHAHVKVVVVKERLLGNASLDSASGILKVVRNSAAGAASDGQCRFEYGEPDGVLPATGNYEDVNMWIDTDRGNKLPASTSISAVDNPGLSCECRGPRHRARLLDVHGRGLQVDVAAYEYWATGFTGTPSRGHNVL